MALNLSTLTSPTTSGDVLAEMLTTADFLDSVPVLRNLSRSPFKGGDAKQTTALNQPKALPLIKNPSGKLGGYLYIPNVSGNYATGPSVTIGANETWEGELDMVVTQWGGGGSMRTLPMGGGDWASGFGLIFYTNEKVRLFSKSSGTLYQQPSGVTLGTTFNAKYGYDGTNLYVDIDGARIYTTIAPDQSGSITHTLELNQQTLVNQGNYAIQKAKLTVASSVVFECDFNGSTSIPHNDTKFQCATGQTVTINQSGTDPATIIKRSVLRFNGSTSGLSGLFNQTIDGGYMFAAFSVLGDGGESNGRVFTLNSTGENDNTTKGYITAYGENGNILSYSGAYGNNTTTHANLYSEENGDLLLQNKFTAISQLSKVNNADVKTNTANLSTLSIEEFNIGDAATSSTSTNAAIDLEYLALFPATISDAEAARVVTYINNRNNVFDLKDGFGHYFYDGTKAPVGAISSGSASWNGRIVGSDNGDVDKYATQATSSDQPVSDGYKVTFADNTDHLDIPSTTQAGWQIVGTSLGTFAYRVNANAVTELNLLGNLGSATYRKAGQSYGMILLPETANGKEIEAARKLLIDRGAADGTTASSLALYWISRHDMVEFKGINTSSVSNLQNAYRNCGSLTSFPFINTSNINQFSRAWQGCTSLNSFPLIDTSSGTTFSYAWDNNSSLTSFPALDMSSGATFQNAWQSCTALTSFPAGAQLGTSANNVNFSSAWQSSGLTSFPADIDLSKGTTFSNAWRQSGLSSFPAIQSTQNGTTFLNAWYNCVNMTSFGNANLNKSGWFQSAWQYCYDLEDFPALFTNWNPSTITTGVFNAAWDGSSALTAQSVENILTSIDASGKYATSTGASGGSALADAGIDITYNVATGALSAATNTAVTSLKSKGWVVIVNNVTL